ncbi:MAG: hypothetical protein ACLQVG_14795 [Terriglobia bacterium]
MRKEPDSYEWWLKKRQGRSLANTLLPYISAAILLGGVIYAVLKWLKIL